MTGYAADHIERLTRAIQHEQTLRRRSEGHLDDLLGRRARFELELRFGVRARAGSRSARAARRHRRARARTTGARRRRDRRARQVARCGGEVRAGRRGLRPGGRHERDAAVNEDDVRALLPPDHPDYRRPIPPPTELVSRDELAATALELARADAALAELLAQHAARLDDLEAHTLTVAVLELKPGSLIVVDLGTGADEHSVADATLAVDAALDAAGVDRDGIGVLFVSDGVELTVIEGEQ